MTGEELRAGGRPSLAVSPHSFVSGSSLTFEHVPLSFCYAFLVSREPRVCKKDDAKKKEVGTGRNENGLMIVQTQKEAEGFIKRKKQRRGHSETTELSRRETKRERMRDESRNEETRRRKSRDARTKHETREKQNETRGTTET